MVDRRQIERAREKRATEEAKKIGLPREGLYKITTGKGAKKTIQWVSVEVAFYPKVQWWITDMTDYTNGHKPIKGTRRKLDAATIKRLEDWL